MIYSIQVVAPSFENKTDKNYEHVEHASWPSCHFLVCESGTLTIDAIISDHRATCILLSSSINYNPSYKRQIWAYKNADFKKLNYRIENCDWAKRINKVKTIKLSTKNFPSEFLSCVLNKPLPFVLTTNHGFETKHSKPKRIPIGPHIERSDNMNKKSLR